MSRPLGYLWSLRPDLSSLRNLIILTWVLAVETVKIGYITTCDCNGVGQLFNGWFFPAFQHLPYTTWNSYHGLVWLGGPYSLLWYLLNLPAYSGYYVFFGYVLAVDLAVFLYLYRKGTVWSLYYLALTVWFTTLDPVDFFPITFSVLGRYKPWMLILAPIVKLPLGAPVWVWQWAFTSSNSFMAAENHSRYLILGAVWVFSLLGLVWDRKTRNGDVHSGKLSCHVHRTARPAPAAR